MKKLALASVAFAAVSAFGAGNSFASPTVTFSTSPSSTSSWDDYATWTGEPGGAPTVSTVVASTSGNYSVTTSVVSHRGVTVTAGLPNVFLGAGSSTALYNGVQNDGHNVITLGFPTNESAIYGSTGGQMNLDLSSAVDGIGFYLSPDSTAGTVFYARVSVFGDTTNGTGQLLGSQSFSHAIQTSCTANSCAFVSASAGSNPSILGITKVTVLLSSTSGWENPMIAAVGSPVLNEPQSEQQPQPTPEPATVSVLGVGLLGLAGLRRRRRTAAKRQERWRWSPFGRWRVSG